jgi:hypothetical protein
VSEWRNNSCPDKRKCRSVLSLLWCVLVYISGLVGIVAMGQLAMRVTVTAGFGNYCCTAVKRYRIFSIFSEIFPFPPPHNNIIIPCMNLALFIVYQASFRKALPSTVQFIHFKTRSTSPTPTPTPNLTTFTSTSSSSSILLL